MASASGGSPTSPVRGSKKPLSVARKLAFALVAMVGVFVALECVLALVGVRPALEQEDPYVGFASNVPLFVERPRLDGKTYHVTAENKVDWFNVQYFPVKKPKETYRIFCLGGSTTYGRPYDDKTSFCGWLRELLPAADPSREWEVINAGGISYASYRIARLMEELVLYEPDLFIVYTGHNEFLERRTYSSVIETPEVVRWLGSTLGRTRTYTAVRQLLRPAEPSSQPQDGEDRRFELPGEVKTLLDGAVGPEDYSRDDALAPQVIEHLRFNLTRCVGLARHAGARVVLVTPASNLRECSPFKSEHRADLPEAERQRWTTLVDNATSAHERGAHAHALQLVENAAQIDDRHAALHYLRGQFLYALERFADAKLAFRRARDEDICPLRALTGIREVVASVATELEVPHVDFAALIEKEAAHGIPGTDLFYDHVHPTIAGHRLLALELIKAMRRASVLDLAASWSEAVVEAVLVRVEATLDDAAQGGALRNLAKVLGWAGKLDEADKLAIQAASLLPDDANAQYLAGNACDRDGQLEAARRRYEEAVRLAPDYADAHHALGAVLEKERNFAKAMEHYERSLQLRPDFAAHADLGGLLARQGDLPRARTHLQAALRLKPGFSRAHNDLGTMLAKEGLFDEAGTHFTKAIASEPDFAEAHNNLGLVLAQRGELESALKHFEMAVRIEPNYERARSMLQQVRAILGRQVPPR